MSKLAAARLEALYGFLKGQTTCLDNTFFRMMSESLGLPRPEVDKLIDHLVEEGRVELSINCGMFVNATTVKKAATCAR